MSKKELKHAFFMFSILGICVFSLPLVSCTTFQASGLQMGGRNARYQVLGDFNTKVWVHKFLGQSGGATLFNIGAGISEGAVQSTIMREVQARGGTSAINVKLKWGSNPIQWILNGLTWNIWAPTTLTISGIVIKEE
jgi:hypothetical protein